MAVQRGPPLDRIAAQECGPVFGHPLRAQQLTRQVHQLALGRSLQALTVHNVGELGLAQSLVGDSRTQLQRDVAPIDVVVLGLARIQRRGLGRPRTGVTALGHPSQDLLAPTAVIAQHRPRHPPDLRRQLARRHRLPLDPQPSRQLGPQLGVIQRRSRLQMRVERLAVQRGPAPVRAGHIGDDYMGMQLRIPSTADPMHVLGADEPFPHQPRRATATATCPTRLGLQVAKRRSHRSAVGRQSLSSYPGITGRVQNRNRFGRAVGHIPTRDTDHARPQHLAGRRVAPLEQRAQLTAAGRAVEAQRLGATAGPLPRRLAAHRVVVLGAARDLALVVILVSGRELAQAHHDGHREIALT
jgi:hypothetical protein